MSVTYITQPSANEPAYKQDALLYEMVEEYSITAKADDAGNLQVTVGTAGATAAGAAGTVYLDILDGYDLIETAVVDVLSTGASTVTVNQAYDAGFSSTGTLRTIRKRTFFIRTGYTGVSDQPLRESELKMFPDPKGVYKVNAKRAATARFDFIGDPADDEYAHNTKVNVYEEFEGVGTLINAFKQVENTTPALSIAYRGRQGLISYKQGGRYRTQTESVESQTLAADGSIQMYVFAGKKYTVNFGTFINDGSTTITAVPSGPPFWYSLILDGSIIQGVEINVPEAGDYAIEFNFNNGVDPVITYAINVKAVEALEVRDACNRGLFVTFWHPNGGWCQYEFANFFKTSNEGGKPTLSQQNNVVRPTSTDDQQEVYEVAAQPEGEIVFDYLNQMALTMQIFEIITTGSDYNRIYLQTASQAQKNKVVYKATENRWRNTFIKSKVQSRINEGR